MEEEAHRHAHTSSIKGEWPIILHHRVSQMMRLLSVDRIDLRLSLSSSSPSSKMEEPSFAPNQSLRIAFFFLSLSFFLIIHFLFDQKKKKKALLSECVSSRSSGRAPAKTSLDDAVRFDLTGYNRRAYLAAKLSVQLCRRVADHSS